MIQRISLAPQTLWGREISLAFCSVQDAELKGRIHYISRSYLIAWLVKNLPAMQEIQVRFLGWENPLEKEMATHSSILTWRTPWTEEPGGLQSMVS